jgi:hypothetical protein
MEEPSAGKLEIRLGTPRDSGGKLLPSTGGGAQVLYILLLIPGVFVSLSAQGAYPPLNSRLTMGVMLGLFLLPVALLMLSWARRPPHQGAGPWRTVFIGAGLALVLWGVALFVNGGLDRAPSPVVRCTILRKTSFATRRGRRYTLTITSWRPGRSQEIFRVGSSVFERAVVGKSVTVDLHPGYFGLGWYGHVSPQ